MEIVLFLGPRGQENLCNLRKSSFAIKKDGPGDEYVELVKDEMTKNFRENDDHRGGIIYATKTVNCPVRYFKLYLEKFNPKTNNFFQRQKTSFGPESCWYDNQVICIR